MSRKIPVVAIVGRANVGKSSLFNSLIGRREAIVATEAGTTRDRVTAKASYDNKDFWLVDTAGMKTAEDEFELSIQEQIIDATESADLILVVVSADTPVVAEDRQVATMALKSRKPLILAINKIDKNQKTDTSEWQKLGIKLAATTSATQKLGIEQLLEAISASLPRAKIREAKDRIHLSIVGRPNVGKSSLFNSLTAKQQALVSRQAGTTRDVNKLTVKYHEREIELSDTAGIRRSGKIERGVEKFSVLRALAAIEQSDICLMVMDAQEANTQLDQKIAGLVKDTGRGLILVINKWDLVEDRLSKDSAVFKTVATFPFVPWAPLVFTAATSGQNVTQIYELIIKIDVARHQRLKTPELNQWLRRTVDSHEPPPAKGYLPKLKYMVQEEDVDMPSFKIFGVHTRSLHWSYKRYLERQFREKWPFTGTPVKFWFIEER